MIQSQVKPINDSSQILSYLLSEKELSTRDRMTKLEDAIKLLDQASQLINVATNGTKVSENAKRTILAISKVNRVHYKSVSAYSIWNLLHDLGLPSDDDNVGAS